MGVAQAGGVARIAAPQRLSLPSLLPPGKGLLPISASLQAVVIDRFAHPAEGESERQRLVRLTAGGLALTWAGKVQTAEERLAMELVLDQLADLAKAACASLS